MKTLSKLLIPILAGTFFLNSCGDDREIQKNNNKDNAQKIQNIDTNKLFKYSLKYTALKLIEQGQELDSLNNLYDSLDKKSDTIVNFWKKKGL